MYANGYGVEKNLITATEFCERAKPENICTSSLGILYYAAQQYVKAAECFTTIPDEPDSAYLLSMMYIDGADVGRNLPLAREWAMKATLKERESLLKAIDVDIPDAMNRFSGHLDWSMRANYDRVRLSGFSGLLTEEEMLFPGPYENFSAVLKFWEVD